MRGKLWTLIPASIAFVVYWSTTCRSIWIGDAGEFALALHSFGIAHPPGYPLFTLAGRVFVEAFWFLRPITAAALFNIVVAAASVGVIAFIFRRRLSYFAAIVVSLLFAFAAPFWAETAGVEVYTIGILLLSLTLAVAECSSPRRWLLVTYLFGLSLANHPSALAFGPALLYLWFRQGEYRRWTLLPVHAMLLAIAASVYLYLMVRAPFEPISNWGNPVDFRGLVDHMTLKQYSGWISNSWANLLMSLKLLFRTSLEAWHWIGIVAVASGLRAGWQVARTRTVVALIILVALAALSSTHQALNYQPFYLPALFAGLLLIGNNFIWIETRFAVSPLRVIMSLVGLLAVLAMLFFNYDDQDRSDYRLAEEYGKLILDSSESGLLFTAGDINSFPALYLRYAEEYAPGVEVYDRSVRKHALLAKAEEMTGLAYNDYYQAREVVIRQSQVPVYLAKNNYSLEPRWLDFSKPVSSFGILRTVHPGMKAATAIPEHPEDYDPGDPLSRQLLANLDLARGEELLTGRTTDSVAARRTFALAVSRFDNDPTGALLNDIGIFFRREGFFEMALDTYERALEKPLDSPTLHADINRNISNVHKDMGNDFLREKDYSAAVTSYLKALDYDKENRRVLLNVSLICLRNLADTARGIEYLTRYVDLNPGDSLAFDLLNDLNSR